MNRFTRMSKNTLLILVGLLVVAGVAYVWVQGGGFQTAAKDESQIRAQTEGFGEALQQVSLLAPDDVRQAEMQENYSAYLSPNVLNEWKNDSSHAVGRLTSSPWPARIEIQTVTKRDDGTYEVKGDIIEVTNADPDVARRPVTLVFEKQNGRWLIASVEAGDYY